MQPWVDAGLLTTRRFPIRSDDGPLEAVGWNAEQEPLELVSNIRLSRTAQWTMTVYVDEFL